MARYYRDAFSCEFCGLEIGDPLYCGAIGHSLPHPQTHIRTAGDEICAHCWEVEAPHNHFQGPFWRVSKLDKAQGFMDQGDTQAEAAPKAGMSLRTLQRRLQEKKKNIILWRKSRGQLRIRTYIDGTV